MLCAFIKLQYVQIHSNYLPSLFKLKKKKTLPGGSNPWCCCHLSACPSKANKREDGTTDTSPDKA